MPCAFRHRKLSRHFLSAHRKLKTERREKRSSGWPNAPTSSQMWLLCRLVWWTSVCALKGLFHLTFIHSPASQVSKPHVQQILTFPSQKPFFFLPRRLVHITCLVSSCPELLMENFCQGESTYLPCSSCFSCWISAMACRFKKCNIQRDAVRLVVYVVCS